MQTRPESLGQQSGRAEPRLNFHRSRPAIGGSGECEGRGCGEDVRGGGVGRM